ncbi:ArsR/SmtB family transcription factor [Chloroflexota bacterium]
MDPEILRQDKNEEEAAVFAAFSDPTRLKLVKLLARQDVSGALCVNALAGVLSVSQSAVSQHLRILKNIGLVSGERQGYRIHYIINRQALERYRELISTALSIKE